MKVDWALIHLAKVIAKEHGVETVTSKTHPEFAIDHLKERIAELEGQLAEAKKALHGLLIDENFEGHWRHRAEEAEKREAVLREALEEAQILIQGKCCFPDTEGWIALEPKDVSKVWQIIETALEVK